MPCMGFTYMGTILELTIRDTAPVNEGTVDPLQAETFGAKYPGIKMHFNGDGEIPSGKAYLSG